MIIEKIKMTAGKARDLGEGVIYLMRVKRSTAFKETILVTEGAMMRTTT